MGERTEGPVLRVVESVRCLECLGVYSKPVGGGTAERNPGCPECGYVGWLPVAVPLSGGPSRRRFGGSRRPPRCARSR